MIIIVFFLIGFCSFQESGLGVGFLRNRIGVGLGNRSVCNALIRAWSSPVIFEHVGHGPNIYGFIEDC